jgi:hypothetical protein
MKAMKYLFLYYGGEQAEPGTAEFDRGVQEWAAAKQAMADAGVLIECSALYPVEAATTVRVRDGETLLTDGPAAEIKEQLGGFTLIDCADLDEALKWAARMPAAKESVEVRPLLDAV